MKIYVIFIAILSLTVIATAQNYQIDWYVIASGGGGMSSASFSANGTIGQAIIGESSSPSYIVESGYWVGAGGAGPACDYVVGDVNGSDSYNGLDITYGVAFFKGGNLPMCEPCALCPGWHYCGDVNGSCSYNGLDITYGVAYFKGGANPVPCGDCPPGGAIVASILGQEYPERISTDLRTKKPNQKR